MPITTQRLILTATTLLLLVGCQFAPLKSDAPTSTTPDTPAPAAANTEKTPANPCVANCDTAKTQCEERQHLREQLCQEQVTRLQNDRTPCNTTTNPLCPKPTACLGEDMRLCRVQHQECLARCATVPPPQPKTPAPEPTNPAQP